MQDHLVDGRPQAEITSGQILTDGLKPEREGISGKRLFLTKSETSSQTYFQLPDGLEPVHFIFPKFHVFPKNFLTLSAFRGEKKQQKII